jgi:putative ATP-binding cassette transporter
LAFARILLHNPDIVVLDEATAALDPKSQVKLMELLVEREGMTVVSVGHRPELEAFHTRKIVLERRAGGAKLVRDVELIDPAYRVLWRQLRRLAKGPSRTRAIPQG